MSKVTFIKYQNGYPENKKCYRKQKKVFYFELLSYVLKSAWYMYTLVHNNNLIKTPDIFSFLEQLNTTSYYF